MLRNSGLALVAHRGLILNEVLSLNAQEWEQRAKRHDVGDSSMKS